MKRYIFWLFGYLIALSPIYAQKASIHVKLVDSSFKSYSDYIYEVEIRNDSFATYLIQDTARLRSHIDYPLTDLLYTILEKKVDNIYRSYEKVNRHTGDILPDSCMEYCCNCLFLQKGQRLKLNVPLLSRFTLEPGEYKMQVILEPPMKSCENTDELAFGGVYTDYYFKIP